VIATLFFYDYLLTLKEEASEILLMILDYALTPETGPICVGEQEVMGSVWLVLFPTC